ncbi:uncharacterized protein CC84DRAFT_1209765 [Paraphaeosphaeria sporulosa]|uniref:Uncharacterized protein n=1 Tax=Paraphaeosphaeria sporulosa TaxID=1460663 RepID=A0A177C0E3_9PLEO|nr:uncharacterized protein CC84DRAFT_1209765 [Paraphaeosphaeria sporulosa]OAG00080.1 hypothetical protein CC84DRAFT_1209765 [Paraphaeosphaeria sporulosa]
MKVVGILSLLFTAVAVEAVALTPRADVGDPCKQDNNCYGGAKCCNNICKLGSCTAPGNNAGAKCANDYGCFGGAICCTGLCTLGSCRMDGTCDADNDCYGWCHNNYHLCTSAMPACHV